MRELTVGMCNSIKKLRVLHFHNTSVYSVHCSQFMIIKKNLNESVHISVLHPAARPLNEVKPRWWNLQPMNKPGPGF
jgi:hypothetical protein